MSITTTPRPAIAAGTRVPAHVWRWVHVGLAGLAMVATLPGRTHGLGLITEPLLRDLHLDRVHYASINLWATLIGALFCLPCGYLIDRLGVRLVLTTVLFSLGAVVVVMSRVRGDWVATFGVGAWSVTVMLDLFLLVLLTRGLGQSALSVVSLALVGKSAGRRTGLVMGVYAVVVSLGFTLSFMLVKWAVEDRHVDWRALWAGIGIGVLALGVAAGLAVRPAILEGRPAGGELNLSTDGYTLAEALRTPAFWVFGLATSLYGLMASGISLFNQAVLKELGLEADVFRNVLILGAATGLASNLLCGYLAERWSMGRLLGAALVLMTAALLALPYLRTQPLIYCYTVAMAAVGGVVTVVFFGVWRVAFGPGHLGKIQGVAQMLTVLASALGPLLLALCQRWTASYLPMLRATAGLAALLALCSWWVPMPGQPARNPT